MNELKEKERQSLLKDLEFFTRYYKEVSSRGKQIKNYYDFEIQRIVSELKELGK
jgi:hypothetical protein